MRLYVGGDEGTSHEEAREAGLPFVEVGGFLKGFILGALPSLFIGAGVAWLMGGVPVMGAALGAGLLGGLGWGTFEAMHPSTFGEEHLSHPPAPATAAHANPAIAEPQQEQKHFRAMVEPSKDAPNQPRI